MRYDSEHDFDSEDGTTTRTVPGQLSSNAHWIFGSVVGGMILVGFGFGIWAGAQQPKAPEVAEKKEPDKPDGRTPNPGVNPNPNPGPTPSPNPDPTPTPPKGKDKDPGAGAMNPMPMPPDPPEPAPAVTKAFASVNGEVGKPAPKEPVPVVNSLTYKDVRPILMQYCFECHGNPGKKPGDGIDLTSFEKIMKGGKDGAVLKAGDPKASAIYDSVKGERMPPPGKKGPDAAELQKLHDWIAGGAKPRRTVRRRPVRSRPSLRLTPAAGAG